VGSCRFPRPARITGAGGSGASAESSIGFMVVSRSAARRQPRASRISPRQDRGMLGRMSRSPLGGSLAAGAGQGSGFRDGSVCAEGAWTETTAWKHSDVPRVDRARGPRPLHRRGRNAPADSRAPGMRPADTVRRGTTFKVGLAGRLTDRTLRADRSAYAALSTQRRLAGALASSADVLITIET
jgi:hypothetical protein